MIGKAVDGTLTPEEVELSATKTCADHNDPELGYLQWHSWAAEMSKTHKQLLCGECLRWRIWVPKAEETE